METLATSVNAHQNSFKAIEHLIRDFNLVTQHEATEFPAEIDFLVRGKRKITQSMVRIIREKEQYIITLIDRTLNAKLLPLEFRSGLQTFIYFVNEYLFIAGFNTNNSIGSYTISISPKKT